MHSSRRKGNAAPGAAFTLVELMVVVAVIAILAGITIALSKYAVTRGRQVKTGMDRLKIQNALEEYRSVYGEYPIVGDSNHYPVCYEPDPESSQNVPNGFRHIDLVHTKSYGDDVDWDAEEKNCSPPGRQGFELLPFTSKGREDGGGVAQILIDHRLTYPLMARPKLDGRQPFMEFPKVTVCYLNWRNVRQGLKDLEERGYVGTNVYWRDKEHKLAPVKRRFLRGDPVNRAIAVDPSGNQWAYEGTDGTTYKLTN